MSITYVPATRRRITRAAFGPEAIITAAMRRALKAEEDARLASVQGPFTC